MGSSHTVWHTCLCASATQCVTTNFLCEYVEMHLVQFAYITVTANFGDRKFGARQDDLLPVNLLWMRVRKTPTVVHLQRSADHVRFFLIKNTLLYRYEKYNSGI